MTAQTPVAKRMPAHTAPFSFDDLGQRVETTWEEVYAAAERIQNFFAEVNARFVERESLVRILKYALLLREHVLIWGPHGTGKTAVADTIVRNIKGAKRWSTDLSRFTTETQVFGDFNIKAAQETGQLLHMTGGSLLEAHFANLGEFLDASTALLRSLLRILNERQFLRGPQQLVVPLMTAVANTNTNPVEARKADEKMGAVLDRFLFWYQVRYVQDPANRVRMLDLFLERRYDRPLPELSIQDVQLVSGVVLQITLLTNRYILLAYEELTRIFAERRGHPVSDRRLNKGVQILDASAILARRTEVDWEDLQRLAFVFCESDADQQLFDQVLAEVTGKWQAEQAGGQSNAEVLALDAIVARMPTKPVAEMEETELVTVKRSLRQLLTEVQSFTTSTATATQRRVEVMAQINALMDAVQKRIDGVG